MKPQHWFLKLRSLVAVTLAITFAAAPYVANAAVSGNRMTSDFEQASDAIYVYGIEDLDDLRDLVLGGSEISILDVDAERDLTYIEVISADNAVDGVIDHGSSTLTLFAGPGADGCYLYLTGTKCINHQLWGYYCWSGSWYCYFYSPSCFWKQIPASCE